MPRETAGSGAHRDADRHFALTVCSACHQHARKICAGRDEDEASQQQHAERERFNRSTHRVAGETGLGQLHGQSRVGPRVLASKLRPNRVQIGFGLSSRDARLHASGHPGIPRPTRVQPWIADLNLRLHHHRHPDLRTVEEFSPMESGWCDAEDRVRQAIDVHGGADDAWVARESSGPRLVAQNCKGTVTGPKVIALMEDAAGDRLHTKRVEVVPGREIAPHAVGAAERFDTHRRHAVADQRIERRIAIAQIFVRRV